MRRYTNSIPFIALGLIALALSLASTTVALAAEPQTGQGAEPTNQNQQLFKCVNADGSDAGAPITDQKTGNVTCLAGQQIEPLNSKTFGRSKLDANQDCSVVTRGWLCNQGSLYDVINQISDYLVGIFGAVAVVLILWYIITIIATGGSPDQIANAKKHLIQVAISLGLLISAYAIVKLTGLFP
ncbi:hypothetical protein HYX70_03900 [Candidatus Saccharibacteria bacterium]|nr:hypothetical protein [Candidatus Saccharibacteria bacterium]